MKLTFVDVKYKQQVTLPKEFIESLPKRVMLFLNIQFHHQYHAMKKQLEDAGITVLSGRPKHAWHEGQILGCSVEDWSDKKVDAFVYVGDGLFHPKALLFKNTQSVYIYDPKTEKAKVLTKEDIASIERKRKGALAKFISAKNIGVLITTKYGQSRMQPALKLQKKYPDKTFYMLLGDTIDFGKLEDFTFIECYINTACPRIMDDHEKLPQPVLNIEDLGIIW